VEFERSVIQERVAARLKAAKARGVRLGRPPMLAQHRAQVAHLVAEGTGVRSIARLLKISVGSAFKLVIEIKRDAAPAKPEE